MTVRRLLVLLCAVAALHALFFIWYQRPDWNTYWPDQEGYRRLGQVLAETGKFTRFPDAARFIPEVLRTPVYPIFVALIYRVAGVHQIAIALAQTALFVIICALVFAIARKATGSEAAGLAAAAATALFPPIPYFVPLVMTEVWTTMMFTASVWLTLVATERRTIFAAAALGVSLGLTTLSRPVFVLFPFAVATVWIVLMPLLHVAPRPRAPVIALLAAFAVTMLPWFTYNYVAVGRFTLSPAGGVGRGLWEGSWQAMWSGRTQDELTHLAERFDGSTLDERVTAVAAREQVPAEPMLEYVHQWQRIHRIWDTPTDPYDRALARVAADHEYQRVALENLRRQPPLQLARRLARGVFVLWAGEIPFRYSVINRLPRAVIYGCWLVQAVLMCLAVSGIATLARSGRVAAALVLASPIVYITAVHFPLLTEARQSLPAQPTVLALAAIAAMNLVADHLPAKRRFMNASISDSHS
jgi:hypothetical protein